MNVIGGFRVHDGDRNTVQQAKRNEPLFTVIEPVVLEGKGRTLENLGDIPKIQAMRSKVGLPLYLLPGKSHDAIVYTLCMCVKATACIGPTNKLSHSGAVIELGRLTQTPTPHIDAVYACVKLLAKTLAEEKGKLKVGKIG